MTSTGLELIRVMLGVDIEKDIIKVSTAKINLPVVGNVPLVSNDLVTEGFSLKFEHAEDVVRMAAKAKEREKELCTKGKM